MAIASKNLKYLRKLAAGPGREFAQKQHQAFIAGTYEKTREPAADGSARSRQRYVQAHPGRSAPPKTSVTTKQLPPRRRLKLAGRTEISPLFP